MLRWFETWLKVGTLNRIQHEERETWGKTPLLLLALITSLIPRPSHCPFLFASSFNVLESVKNWMMGRLENDATPNQACSNLLLPPPTEQYHRFTASNRYTAIAQTRSSVSCHLVFTHTACTPKPLWSRLQTTSRKWFTNRFANRFLNRFSAFTPGVSKPIQQKPAWEPA